MGEHLSARTWLCSTEYVPPGAERVQVRMRNVAHRVTYLREGEFQGRWICRGREFAADCAAGAVRFHAADGDEHVLAGAVGNRGMLYSTLIIPPNDRHLRAVADHVARLPAVRPFAWPDDATLRGCLDALLLRGEAGVMGYEREDAARSLVLRVATLLGAPKPEWRGDTSGFTNTVRDHLVDYIDTHLAIAPSAADLAVIVGLSPSHFARKFRVSVGMSLQRFVMQRRIQASLEMLKDRSRPLARIAMELGFSSQSHFTRMFFERTGMTPAKYRKQCKPTVG